MKEKRSLSGVFFRFKNPKTNKFENRCFEDLPLKEQDRVMENQNIEWLKSLSKRLALVLRDLGDFTNITKEED